MDLVEDLNQTASGWPSPYSDLLERAANEIKTLRTENAEYRELLRELLVQLCENPGSREDGNAPGHAHEVPGVWDSDAASSRRVPSHAGLCGNVTTESGQ